MKKLNTHTVYQLALRIHPLVSLEYKDGMDIGAIFPKVLSATMELNRQLGSDGYFSPSLKRAAGAVLRAIYGLGIPSDDVFKTNISAPIDQFKLYQVTQSSKEFETILSNELPGLATYVVSQKGDLFHG